MEQGEETMEREGPQVVCVACGELVPLASCTVDVGGDATCNDCQVAGRGIEGEVWTAPLHDWTAPHGGRS